jgi:PKD repeat protein
MRQRTDYVAVTAEPPVADFSGTPTTGMRPLRVEFIDLSTGVINSYYWEFGDGQVSTEQSPKHDYHLPGDYTVTLTATGPGGTDLKGKINYIHVDETPPVADFIAHPARVARNTGIHFTDLSIGAVANYYWEFGDGNTSTEQHPIHAYQSAGYYTVRLTVSAPAGSDMKERTDYIDVNSGPVSEFAANPTSGTRPVDVQFTDQSMGVVTGYLWEFGDGYTSTEQNPSHQYPGDGDYTVRLTVTGPNGSDMKERIDHIHVGDETWWAKTFGAAGSFGNDRGETIQATADGGFIVAGWAALGADLWISKLNSDGTIRWQKAYAGSLGDKADSVEVTADGGCIVAGNTFSFGDSLHPDIWLLKLDAEGNPEWERLYGDIDTQRVGAIEEKTQDGGYIVCGEGNFKFWILKLNADGTVAWEKTYDDGGWNRANGIEETADGGYIVAGDGDTGMWVLKLNADGTVAWQKTYGGVGLDGASSIVLTLDGGYVMAGSTTSFGQGKYDVWLMKINADGTVAWEKTYGGSEDEQALHLRQSADGYVVAGWTESFGEGFNNYPDVWVLSVSLNGEIPGCTAMGTSAATVTDTAVVPVDTSALVLNTYLLPSITSLDPFDTAVETSTVCTATNVSQADFTADPTSGILPLAVQFSDQSTGTITDWLWDFGDGNTSTEQYPSHTYDVANQYTVSLTIDGPDGTDVETKPNYIDVQHFAEFIGSPQQGDAPLTVFFLDNSTGAPFEWLWDFGDGKTSTRRNPTHTYYDVNDYTVSLTATNANGPDTITKTDYISLPVYGVPYIKRLKPRSQEPKKRIRIIGHNFADTPDDVIVHFANKTFDGTSSRIKLWSNQKIIVVVPGYGCGLFDGYDTYRVRKVWVTINGVDSNKRKLRVLKPVTCP